MNTTLLRFMLRRHWLSIPLCALVPIFIGIVIGLIYPTYSRERELLEQFSQFANQFINKGGSVDLFSPEGSFSLPFQHPTVLIIYAVIAAIPAMALPAGERGRNALDLLLSTQLSRATLVRSVALLNLAIALLIGATAYGGALLGATLAEVLGQIPLARVALVAVNAASLCLFWGGVALLISVLARDRAMATLQYGVAVFCFLCLDVASRLMKSGDWLAWFTPYGYLRPARIVGESAALSGCVRDILILSCCAAGLYALAVVTQQRRRSA